MNDTPHIIKSIKLELEVSVPPKEAFLLQEELKIKIKEIIDNVFSQFVLNEKTVLISRLRIDLGTVSKKEFASKLAENMTKELQNALVLPESPNTFTSWNSLAYEEQLTTHLSNPQKALWVLTHFLKTGHLPWWAKNLERNEWEELSKEAIINKEQNFIATIVSILLQTPQSIKRLVYQFSKVFQLTLFESIIKSIPESIPAVADQNSQLQNQKQSLLSKNIFKNPIFSWTQLLEYYQVQTIDLNSLKLKPTVPERSVESANFTPSFHNSKKIFAPQHSSVNKKNGLIVENNSQAPLSAESNHTNEDVYIQNAGLALILNCLVYLFEELGYLDENRSFQNQDIQERAIHLLQYIATEEVIFPEEAMILNKLVCGWPLNEPLRTNVGLSPIEIQKSDEFLQDIILQWGTLKNTTPSGLRYNFLLRNGKLSEKSNYWLLQVEKTGYDALLMEKLPWSVSVVKFNWMPKRLHVEWVN